MTIDNLFKRPWLFVPLAILLGSNPIDAPAQQPDAQEGQSFWEGLRRLHENALKSGEKVPTNFMDWVKEDIQRTGSWEYRIISLPEIQDDELEKRFNQLGQERWEIFWIQPSESGLRLYLKRPTTTYLQSLPLSEYLRLLPKKQ